jgi:AbrB family looped-hinge helix DNA binding protein
MNKHHRPTGKKSAAAVSPAPSASIRNRVRLKVDSAGRVLIPSELRSQMGVTEGSTVLAWLEQGELRVLSAELASKQAQQLAKTLLPGNTSLADELIADRREEARRESEDG